MRENYTTMIQLTMISDESPVFDICLVDFFFLSEVDEIRTNAAISLLEIQYGHKMISICYDRIYVHIHVSYIIIS